MSSQGCPAARIMLAHPHPVVRLGVRAVLASEAEYVVIGETGDGPAVIPFTAGLQPDLLLVDITMPGFGGLATLQRVRMCSPHTRVVILATRADEASASKALQAGAAAYVVNGVSATVLIEALREAVAGECYVSPPLLGRVVFQRSHGPVAAYETLTPREREILQLSADGLTASAIAGRLCVSQRTVEKHRANLLAKLSLRTQTELLRYALRLGIVSEEPLHTGTHG